MSGNPERSRRSTPLDFALSGVFFQTPGLIPEKVGNSVGSNGQNLLRAGKIVPSSGTSTLRGIVAAVLLLVIVKYIDSIDHSLQQGNVEIRAGGLLCRIFAQEVHLGGRNVRTNCRKQAFTSNRYGRSRNGSNEIGGIRIIDHAHSSHTIEHPVIETLNIASTLDRFAQVKFLGKSFIMFSLVLQLLQLLETISHQATTSNVGEIVSNSFIESIGAGNVLIHQQRGGSSKSAVNNLWVLHSEPSREHTSIRSTKRNDGGILESSLFLEFLQEDTIIGQSLFRTEVLHVLPLERILSKR
mmetsp:Transcript_18488/g.20973  ORF Transcript_18488/g.20973 Transcript_18488/m.20973 type:complete len:298 (-) Transcript_18488:401-1294(-)